MSHMQNKTKLTLVSSETVQHTRKYMQSRRQIVPDTRSRDWKTAWSIVYHSHSRLHRSARAAEWRLMATSASHDSSACLLDSMLLFYVSTCQQQCTACILFADRQVARVSRPEVLL